MTDERYDLASMLQEIREDEAHAPEKPRQLSRQDIQRLVEERRKKKPAGGATTATP
jgi:hypothetical protein